MMRPSASFQQKSTRYDIAGLSGFMNCTCSRGMPKDNSVIWPRINDSPPFSLRGSAYFSSLVTETSSQTL